jgi:5-formyltetrahydrofolate cyclo-ligase
MVKRGVVKRMNKKDWRTNMKKTLSQLNQIDYKKRSLLIAEALFASKEWLEASTIAVTVSRFPEVNTKPIIEKAWEQGKRIAVPRCLANTKQLDFRRITSHDQVEEGFFGLSEPIASRTEEANSNEFDLVLVPGLVYSCKGYRIGFGGGYYDRFLSQIDRNTISLAFSEQVVSSIPIEQYDLPVNKVITEDGVVYCE